VIDRVLAPHVDALFDSALAVTADADLAVEAVREAVTLAVGDHGPDVGLPALLGAVLDASVQLADGPQPLDSGLLQAGDGSLGELQRVSLAATQTLEPRLRGIVDLTLRQGLPAEDLSEALGVAPGLVAATTQEALEHADHVVGAVLLARVGQDDCPGLAALVDGVEDDAEKLAAGVSEHQDVCPACGDRRRALVPATVLLAALPPAPAPAALRRPGPLRGDRARPRTATRASGRTGRRRRARLPVVAGAVGAAVALVAGGIGIAHWGGSEPRSGPAPAASGLSLPTEPLDFGSTGDTSTFDVANRGPGLLMFTVRSGVPWLAVGGGERTVPPGQHLAVAVSLDRGTAPEGDATGELRVVSNGGSGVLPVRAGVERPPGLAGVEITPQSVIRSGCPGSTPAQVRTAVIEESGVDRVELHWRLPGGGEEVAGMTREDASFLGALGPFAKAGDVDWWVSATDIRGNHAASAPQALRVTGC
jgi:hypothetical protein